MNLVKQQQLFFKNEKSDKVYEVSLFQVDSDQYIVNFRYGRRGSVLREGTKTVFPVTLDQAESVFQELIQSKRKKGYNESSKIQAAEPIITTHEVSNNTEAEETIVSYLRDLSNGIPIHSNWKTSRIIWRAGELDIIEAHSHVASLMNTSDIQEKYAAIWYCGRVRTQTTLRALVSENLDPRSIWFNIHRAALIAHGSQETIEDQLSRIPEELKNSIRSKDYKSSNRELERLILDPNIEDINFLLDSYLLSIHIPEIKTSIIRVLPLIRLIPNKWNTLRYIYKVAEMMDDGEMLGILYKRISCTQPYYNSSPYGGQYIDNNYVKYIDALKSKKPKLAFSNKTKSYFEKRNIRSLLKAGLKQTEYYCSLASSILIQYNEEDRIVHGNSMRFQYDRATRSHSSTTYEYPDIAHLSYLYYIIYSNGERFAYDYDKKFNYKNGARKQTTREEAFPSLWDAYPKHIVKLLTHGKLQEVADFGFLLLKGREDIDQLFSLIDLNLCIHSPFNEVLNFSIEKIKKRYNPEDPNIDILTSLIKSNNEKAQNLAFELIEKNNKPVVGNILFLDTCLSVINPRIQSWLILNFSESDFDSKELQLYIDTFIINLANIEFEKSKIQANTLTELFPISFKNIDKGIIIKLIAAEKELLVLFGCKLFNKNNISVSEIPYETINKLIHSENKSIQEQGLLIFSKLSDSNLIDKKKILYNLVQSPEASIRDIALETIGRIASTNTPFKRSSYLKLIELLDNKYEDEAIPESIYTLIEKSYSSEIHLLENNIDELIESDKREIHLLVLDYINSINLANWPLRRIALLGNHDMKLVRDLSKNYYTENVARIQYESYDGIRILNTQWDDVRIFSEDYFNEHFSEKQWTPDLIISLCDNVNPKVQQFGIQLLGKYFKDENGIKFLTELSQHPSSNLQLYTSNYLNKFALNNLEVLQDIEFYFNTVLHIRNKDSAVRKRVIMFLDKQAEEGPEYASYVAKLLQRQKNTIAIMDQAQIIKTLFKIKKNHPSIETGIEIMETEIRL